jgi:hypothetical protein
VNDQLIIKTMIIMLKNINLKHLLTLVLIAGLATMFNACDDEDDKKNSGVVLTSFGPSGVKHGEKIKFIGQNLDQVTAIVFAPNVELPSSAFVSQSSSLIELNVPNAAESGKVTLRAPEGDVVSKTIFNLEVLVTISSIPAEAKPGTNITITGENMNWIEGILFTDEVPVLKADFVSQSATELVVTVPLEAETGLLVFAAGGTEPELIASENPLVVTLPTVSAFAPLSARHEENITITGTDLDLVTSITFPGNKNTANFDSQSETEIVVAVPVGALAGKLTLHQASPINVVTDASFTAILPKGTNVAPKPAIPGTDNLTITGTDLDLVAELSLPEVSGPILKAQFTTHTATQIVFPLPAAAKNGAITYKTIHGHSGSLGVNVLIPTAGPAPLTLAMYDESILFGGGDWSWNKGTSDAASTEQAYSGTKSWKFVTPTDGGVSVGGMSGVNTGSTTHFVFSIYGGPGTNGKNVAAILNDTWGNYNAVTITEGQWKEFKIPLTSYPDVNKANITRWILKVEGMPAGSTIFVDRVGFD